MARRCAGRLDVRRRPWVAALVLTLDAAAATPAFAQIATDGTMGEARPLNGLHETIPAGLGTANGGNLFHSFSEFNIAENGSATFTGPGDFANVISRVTGGNLSNIDGLLKSNIGSSGFFFINPAGVAFGPNASIDVPGAFHVSTADRMIFANGDVLDLATSSGNLSVADPSAFGFLSANPASITVTDADLSVPAGRTLSLIGGALTLDGATLAAMSGVINLASVTSAGEVSLASGVPELTGFGALGPIAMRGEATVSTQGDPGGTIYIRGGTLTTEPPAPGAFGVSINAGTTGATDGAPTAIDIEIAGSILIENAEVVASSSGSGGAGDIHVQANDLRLVGAPFTAAGVIASRVFSSGDGGNVQIAAERVSIEEFAAIVTQIFGVGNGGDIALETGDLEITGGAGLAFVSAATFNAGNAGNLVVNADRVSVTGGSGFTGLTTQVSSLGQGGSAGNLIVEGRSQPAVESLTLLNGGEISASVFSGSSPGGNVEITADAILISGIDANGFSAGIFASSLGGEFTSGNGGTITVGAGSLAVQERGQVSTFSDSLGDSGSVGIVADTVRVNSGGIIGASNFGAGTAGPVTIQADTIELVGPTPPELFDFPALELGPPFTGIASISGDTATGAGTITVTANQQLSILDGAQINALTTGPGSGGRIVVTADSLQASGVDRVNALNAGIVSDSTSLLTNAGVAGSIDISAIDVRLGDGAEISASTQGPGAGGSIALQVANVVALDGAGTGVRTESASAAPDAGIAGNIAVSADTLELTGGAEISTQSARADGGNLDLTPTRLLLVRDSHVTTSVGTGEGGGGNITIGPVLFAVLDNGAIQANAFGGPGGNILIVANNFIATPDSIVEASSQLGIPGTVRIESPDTDVTTGVAVLSESLMDAAARLAQQCGARGGRTLASFVGVGRGGLPVQPGAAMPSHYLAAGSGKLTRGAAKAGRELAGLPSGALFVPATLQIACSV